MFIRLAVQGCSFEIYLVSLLRSLRIAKRNDPFIHWKYLINRSVDLVFSSHDPHYLSLGEYLIDLEKFARSNRTTSKASIFERVRAKACRENAISEGAVHRALSRARVTLCHRRKRSHSQMGCWMIEDVAIKAGQPPCYTLDAHYRFTCTRVYMAVYLEEEPMANVSTRSAAAVWSRTVRSTTRCTSNCIHIMLDQLDP